MFLRKGVLKICSRFTGEHPCRSVISIKLQNSFIEITPRHRSSPVNLLHIFRTPFPRNTSAWVLLIIHKFWCGNCNITYYDKTDRHFKLRSGERIDISHLTRKRVEYDQYNQNTSSHRIRIQLDDLLLHNYDSNLNDFTILYQYIMVSDLY